MSDDPKLDALREAFASSDAKGGGAACPTPESIWAAAHIQLPPAEREAVVAHLRDCPSCCADWKIATSDGLELQRRTGTRRALLAAAAMVVVALLAVVWQRPWQDEGPSFRIGDELTIESLVNDKAGLPRDAFVLRWSPVGQDARYLLEVTRTDLDRVARITDLADAEYRVPPEFLEEIADGEILAWRVEARLLDGTVVASPAFLTTLRPD